ncbi:MAG: TVP38/TMEM64 family protein [Sphingomonadales bacterium]
MTAGSLEPETGPVRPNAPVALILAVAAVLAAGYALYVWLGQLQQSYSTAEFQELILSWGTWGVLASIALMIVHCFVPFPAEFIAIANGMAYGPLWGTVITWTGAMVGAALAFWLTRLLGERFVRRVVAEKNWRRIDCWVEREGAGALFVSRFIPVISFNLINVAAGLTHLRWWTFLWATGLGILPMTTLMVVMGDQLMDEGGWIWLAFLVGASTLWLLFRLLKRRSSSR